MDTISLLHEFGLNEKQAKVYLACLELGTATVQDAANKSGVKRTSIYNFIGELKQMGLINEIVQDRRMLLIAESPLALLDQAEKKKKDAEAEKKKIEKMLPELLGIFNRPGHKPTVKFYEGIAGLKKIYEDTLTEGGPIYAYSDYEKMLPVMGFDYMADYASRRAEKGIQFYSISTPGPWAQKVRGLNKQHKREMKISKDLNFETEINIYGNKAALLSFRRPYAGVIVEDKAVAETFLSIWKWMWKRI